MLYKALAVGLASFIGLGAFSERVEANTLLNEGFDDVNNLPGWNIQNNSSPLGITSYFQGDPAQAFSSQAGPVNAYIGANYNNTGNVGTISDWLLTPELTLKNGDVFSFYTRTAVPVVPDRLEFRLSTEGSSTNVGSSATSVGDFTTLLLTVNPNLTNQYPTSWTQYTVTVSGLDDTYQGRFAFRYFVTNGGLSGSNSNYIGIDTVLFTAPELYWGDGSGNWNNVATDWSATPGGPETLAWDGTRAVFDGISGTVTLTDDVSAEGLDFQSGGFTIAADSTYQLTLTGIANVTVDQTLTATISAPIAGTDGLFKLGEGTLILSGENTYTGGTSILLGTLQVGNGGTTGTILGDVDNSGVLAFNRTDDITYAGVISGSGSLTHAGDGMLTLTGDNTYSGGTFIAAGKFQIGNGGTTGSITGDIVNNGEVIFNRSDDITYSSAISGNGGVTKAGTGTLTLTGVHTYGGSTSVVEGKLLVNGSLTGNVDVQNGATLGGTGSISDLVTVNNGGILSPGSNAVGSLSVGGLNLDNLSQLHFELDTPGVSGLGVNDFIDVAGDLRLDGRLFITALTNFGAGTYYLMQYGSALTDNGLNVVSGPAGYNYEIDTTTANEVNLIVDYTGLQFWDGTTLVGDGTVHGGSGTWDAAATNWTDETGNINNPWDDLTAVFMGTAGTVAVVSNVTVAGMQFGTTGYELFDGGGTIEITAPTSTFLVDGGVDATISTKITGAGGISKTGFGNLILNAANDYTGGTTINAGAVVATFANSLGDGAVTLLSGGELAAMTNLTIDSLTWDGGTLSLLSGDPISITNALTMLDDGTFYMASAVANTRYELLNFETLGSTVMNFSINSLGGLAGHITVENDALSGRSSVWVMFGGQSGGGELSNYAPIFTPTTADFLVSGQVVTSNAANTVNSLTFDPSSSLEVFDQLTVTSGNFNVSRGSAVMNGGVVIVPGTFNLNGLGTLTVGSEMLIGGDANINGGSIVINGPFVALGSMNVHSSVTVNGEAALGGSLNTNGSTITVNGQLVVGDSFNPNSSTVSANGAAFIGDSFNVNASTVTVNGDFAIGGSANLDQGTQLVVNSSGIMVVGTATNINSNSLARINGLLASPTVSVNTGGTLKGTGLIAGNVFNNGIVAPGNSPGVLTILGNYSQLANGTLQIETGDLLVVGGTATLGGTLEYQGSDLEYGQQVSFLLANDIEGEFDQIVMPDSNRFRGRFIDAGGEGILLIAPTSYTLVAETGNQRNVAAALDSYIPASGNDRETVSIALDQLTASEYPAAFDAISPAYYETLTAITIEQAVAQSQMIAQRLSAVRLGARGFQAIGIDAPLVNDKDGKSVLDAKDAKNGKDVITPTTDTKWGVWAMGNGIFSKYTSLNQLPNYRFQNGGFFVGADYNWNEHFATGVFGGYQGTYAKYSNGSMASVNSALFGGYATYQNGGFYSDAIVSGGYNGYVSKRSVAFSTIDRTARANPNGGQLTSYLDIGYDWQVSGFTFGPLISAQYTYSGVAPFTETGADSLDLRVEQQNTNSLRTNLGGRVAYTWNLTDKITIIPEVRMFWQHEYLQNSTALGASLDGGAGPSFDYMTTVPGRDSVFAGAGVSANFGKDFSVFLNYNTSFGRQDYISQMVSTGLNWKF